MTDAPSRSSRWATWAGTGLMLLAFLEFAIMATPFAAYLYAAYSPILSALQETPYLAWLSELYVSHLSKPESMFLRAFVVLGKVLGYGGLAVFCVHAAYLYWCKYVRRTLATRLLYAYIRHPQYSAFVVAGVGLSIAWPRFINLVFLAAMISAYRALARHEERRLIALRGQSYLVYAEQKPMFVPRLVRRLPGHTARQVGRGRLATDLAGPPLILLTLLAIGYVLRTYSIAKLPQCLHGGAPWTQIIAFDPPADVDVCQVGASAIEASHALGVSEPPPILLYLIWDSERLQHFLTDAGVRRTGLEDTDIPAAAMYVVAASLDHPSKTATERAPLDGRDALKLGIRRRLERIWYQPTEASDTPWMDWPFPKTAVYRHCSLPVL